MIVFLFCALWVSLSWAYAGWLKRGERPFFRGLLMFQSLLGLAILLFPVLLIAEIPDGSGEPPGLARLAPIPAIALMVTGLPFLAGRVVRRLRSPPAGSAPD